MLAQSVRERPYAVLVAAMAINVGALLGLFTAAPVFEASASVVITAKDAATPGVTAAPDLDQVAARTITKLRASGALAAPDGADLTLTGRSLDGSHVLVATATADSRAAAETLTRNAGDLARTQIQSGSSGVTAELVENPAVVSDHTVSAARILIFGGSAGLVALVLIAMVTPTARRPVETTRAAPRTPESPTPTTAGVLRLAPTVDDDVDVDLDELLAPTRQTVDRPKRQSARQRQATIKRLVQEDWARSGSNVAWTKQQTKAAFERAERQLDAVERGEGQGGDSNPATGSSDRNDDWQSWGFGG